MPPLPLARSAYKREYAHLPELKLVNRFFEENPLNLEGGAALLSRAPTTFETAVGEGPIRGGITEAGAFSDDAFVVSGQQLWRLASDGTKTHITGTVSNTGDPDMAIITGLDFEHLFIADGLLLQYYDGPSFATSTLTLTPDTPPDIAAQTVEVGGVYYQFVASLSGSPDGSSGNPFQVLVGADDAESLQHLFDAINASGTAGTDYSSTITSGNTQVDATAVTATTIDVRADNRGSAGNSITTSVTGAHLTWDGATLSGGGVETLKGVTVPDGAGIVSVATIDKYLIAVRANSDRWYYIEPGELTIDPLNFYEAERRSDEIHAARVLGDTLLFLGDKTLEPWYSTGDATPTGDPFLPDKGRVLSRGTVAGTDAQIGGLMVVVGDDGRVYSYNGGSLQRISHNGIEERIRIARRKERESA